MRSPLLFAAAVLAFALPLGASAQALPAGVPTFAISHFAAGSRVATDFNSTEYGFIAGTDFTRHLRNFDAALEMRGTFGAGEVVNQKTITAGVKLAKSLGRIAPYIDVLAGEGFLTYNHPAPQAWGPHTSDTAFITVFGGGIDYQLSPRFAIKADYNLQSWKISADTSRFTPNTLALGLTYRPRFRSLRSQ